MSVKFDVIKELTWRGMLNQVTDEKMGEFLMAKPRTIYTGFDPTADSLHVGHLVAIMNLRRFQKAGHRPIPLVGGATGMIGDPSGRSDERNLLTEDQVRHNVECIKKQLSRFVDFDSKENGAILVNNYDWMKDYSFLNFLRDIGKMFQVNVMMTKDSVKSRLESENGLSYTEFSYMLLQSYDFVHLCREYGCEIQAGGSDQWGNITAGIDLARRMLGVQLYGFTSKLLLKSDGKKMGKSESGALWLDPNRTSPYQFYQYWVNVDDADIENAFKFFTDMTEEEATALIAEHRDHLGQRVLQKQVAKELTLITHGESGLASAEKATAIFFGAAIEDLSDAELTSVFSDVPSKEFSREQLDHCEIGLLDAFVLSGLAKTKSDARRAVQQGGAYVNNKQVTDVNKILSAADLASETVVVLRSGKKRYALLKFV
ncbi:MAG: tyrosine--tRNA ligase [Thermoguttaceae bacterium]|nr:tyrosine--tRNA ligase [Thermoguttaceae bacterium]